MNSDSRFYRPRNGVVVEVCLGERGWEIWLHTEIAGGNYQFRRHFIDGKFGSREETIAAAHDHKFSSEQAERIMQGTSVPLDVGRWWTTFPEQEIVKHRFDPKPHGL